MPAFFCTYRKTKVYCLGIEPGQPDQACYAAECRLGTILVNGSFENATVVASGVSDIYLSGLKGTVVANLAGAADLLVNASKGAPLPQTRAAPATLFVV